MGRMLINGDGFDQARHMGLAGQCGRREAMTQTLFGWTRFSGKRNEMISQTKKCLFQFLRHKLIIQGFGWWRFYPCPGVSCMASWHFPSDWTFRISPDIVWLLMLLMWLIWLIYSWYIWLFEKEIFPRWILGVLVQGRKGGRGEWIGADLANE